jgi:Tfp pilus assembly protein PilN
MSEINIFIAAVKKLNKLPKIMVLLKDKSPSLKELLKLQMNLPIRILNEIDIKFKPSGPQAELPYNAIGGLLESLWTKANGLDLLKRGRRDRPRTPMIFTVTLMLSILAMWILYMIAPLKIEGTRLHEIDRQIMLRKEDVRKVETLKKEIDSLNDEISTINNFKENKPKALNILKELTAILPKTTWLTRVRITESTVDIEGYSSSASLLLPKLEASTSFKKAEFSSPTFRDARMNADRFNIKMEIEGIKKDEGERLKNEKE